MEIKLDKVKYRLRQMLIEIYTMRSEDVENDQEELNDLYLNMAQVQHKIFKYKDLHSVLKDILDREYELLGIDPDDDQGFADTLTYLLQD